MAVTHFATKSSDARKWISKTFASAIARHRVLRKLSRGAFCNCHVKSVPSKENLDLNLTTPALHVCPKKVLSTGECGKGKETVVGRRMLFLFVYRILPIVALDTR